MLANVRNVETVITGHTPVLAWSDLRDYADFSRDFVAWAGEQVKAGKTVEQAAEYRVPARYKGYTPEPGPQMGVMKANIEIVFNELKR